MPAIRDRATRTLHTGMGQSQGAAGITRHHAHRGRRQGEALAQHTRRHRRVSDRDVVAGREVGILRRLAEGQVHGTRCGHTAVGGSAGTVGVGTVIATVGGVIALHELGGFQQDRLGLVAAALAHVVLIGRVGHRRQNADDDHHDEQLDQRDTPLNILVFHYEQCGCHVIPPYQVSLKDFAP